MRRAKFAYPRGKPTGITANFSSDPLLTKDNRSKYGEYNPKEIKLYTI